MTDHERTTKLAAIDADATLSFSDRLKARERVEAVYRLEHFIWNARGQEIPRAEWDAMTPKEQQEFLSK